LGDCFLWAVTEKYRNITIFWATFPGMYIFCVYFDKKMGWATFWSIFSQAHLVTLLTAFAAAENQVPECGNATNNNFFKS
jgi:hypothetical protein